MPALRERLDARGITDIRLSRAPGDERRLACEAAAGGVETVIALGGDGTWGNAARGILDSRRDARLALLVAGTGNDFAHAIGLPVHETGRLVDIALGSHSARVDVGAVNGTPFLNVVGFGLETSVLERIRSVPLLRGPVLYIATAIPMLRTYSPMRVRIGEGAVARYLAIVAANGPRFGGGFRVAPDASVVDGRLDIVTVTDAPTLRRANLLARVRVGRHRGQREVGAYAAERLMLQFGEAPLMDLDGELTPLGADVAELTCRARALRVAVGADSPLRSGE